MSPRSLTNNRAVSLLTRLHRNLVEEGGFDICHLFHPAWYNQMITRESLSVRPLSASGRSVGLLVGNTKRLWPRFCEWYAEPQRRNHHQDVARSENPFDTFVEEQISMITKQTITDTNPIHFYWSHDTDPDRLVAMSRLASCAGLTYLDQNSYLSIHPEYGAWHSFRAAIVIEDIDIDHTGLALDPDNPPPPQPRLLTQDEEAAATHAMQHALNVSKASNNPPSSQDDIDRIQEQTEAWIAVRDVISRGKKEYRFDHDQLYYHYTKDSSKYLKS